MVGLINCFSGISIIAARLLLNGHDFVTCDDRRGQSVGQAFLPRVEQRARELGTAAN